MTPFELEKTLSNIKVTVDTREQATTALADRLSDISFEYERKKLDFGDYSCKVTLTDGAEIDFATKFAIERKMSLDELSRNFTASRDRFAREFQRAKDNGGKIYLLVENASWDAVFAGRYKTKFNKESYVASLMAWQARYNTQLIFCTDSIAPLVIYKTLRYELKERLERMCEDGT